MKYHGMSITGRVRKHNEDAFLIAELGETLNVIQSSAHDHVAPPADEDVAGRVLMVADGMGGHSKGEVASKIAIDTMSEYMDRFASWFSHLDSRHEDDLVDELKSAVEACEWNIRASGEDEPDQRSMGTTLTMAYVLGSRLYLVHVGDSRCYLFRDGSLRQLSTDHTIAEGLVEAGVADDVESVPSRWADVLLNAVGGGGEDVKPEVTKTRLQKGDILLLCSDGLTKHVDDKELAEVLGKGGSVEALCEKLVEAAIEDGGTDNITAIVADFVENESGEKEAMKTPDEENTADQTKADEPESESSTPDPGRAFKPVAASDRRSGDDRRTSRFSSHTPPLPGYGESRDDSGPTLCPRTSWAAVFAGVTVALMTNLMISVLGISVGISAIDLGAGAVAIGAGLWWIVGGLTALFFGGWIAGHLSDTWRTSDGIIHGLLVWAVSSLLTLVLVTTAIGAAFTGVMGMLAQGMTAVAGAAANAARYSIEETIRSEAPLTIDVDALRAEVQQALGEVDAQPESGTLDGKIMPSSDGEENEEPVLSSTETVPTTSPTTQKTDTIDTSSEDVNIESEKIDIETQALVAAWEIIYQRAKEDARNARHEAEKRLRDGTQAAAPGLASAARWAFLFLLFGAIVASCGGAAGRRRTESE